MICMSLSQAELASSIHLAQEPVDMVLAFDDLHLGLVMSPCQHFALLATHMSKTTRGFQLFCILEEVQSICMTLYYYILIMVKLFNPAKSYRLLNHNFTLARSCNVITLL